jgi:hypothetical protein
MKNIVITLAMLSILFMSCSNDNLYITGEGEIITTEISIDAFKGIESFGTNQVTITRGHIQKVEVTGHSNIINRLKKDVYNGIWYIELEEGNYRNADLSFQIVVPLINEVVLSGSGEIKLDDFTSEEDVAIEIYGSGDIELNENLGCKDLNIRIEGSGSIYTMKNFNDLDNLDINIIGSGDFSGFPVMANNCDVYIEGSSVCKVTVETILDVEIIGSGVINYKGNPTINSNISGLGKVNNSN